MHLRPKKFCRALFGIICLLFCQHVHAQVVITAADSLQTGDTSKILIASIKVQGNKRTKDYIIRREMQFAPGDSMRRDLLQVNFLQAKNQVYNTNLFTEVELDSSVNATGALDVLVTVKEKWYIYPTPEFRLADRSFNEWIKVYHADLNRVVYGVKFAHYNFTGRRDPLRVYLLNGYARNFSFSYNNPYSNRKLTVGFGVGAGFTQNREISIATSYNNKQVFYSAPGFVRRSAGLGASLSKREGFFKTTAAAINISYIDVDQEAINRNPNYFAGPGRTRLIPTVSASVRYVNTNNNNYPLKGKVWGASISKSGTGFTGGINNVTLSGEYARFIPHGRNFYSSITSGLSLKLPFDQAFINRRAMGFNGFTLRGLEYYVIDGVATGIAKYTFSKKLVAFDIPVPFKIKALPKIPIKVFAKTFADAGYAYLPDKYQARLNNKLLYTGGFGIDILTVYDINIRFDYCFNQLGEKGLFLRGSGGF